MPDIRKITFLYEGDDDKAVLEKLLKVDILPFKTEIFIAKREKDKYQGKDGLFGQLIPLLTPSNGIDARVVVLIDLDDLDAAKPNEQFEARIRKIVNSDGNPSGITVTEGQKRGRVRELALAQGRRRGSVVLVPVGCPEDGTTNDRFGIDRYAIDDWVLRLVLNPTAFESVSEFKGLGHERALLKFSEVAELFRKNGLEVRKAKTYLQILRAISDIRPSTATIIGRIVENACTSLGKETFESMLKPFLDDLRDAIDILRETDS